MILTGRTVEVGEAERMGLVARVCAGNELEAAALEVAEQIASYTSFGLRRTKEVLWHNLEASSVAAAIAMENRNQELAVHEPEVIEYMQSYARAVQVAMKNVKSERRIDYAGSVHDEREIEAVVQVLRGGPTALRIGKNVRAMEERVAALFGKRRGVMCNSGSSALYLAIEVLDLRPGDEIITSPLTFSTDIAPMIRAGIAARVRGRDP